MNPETPGAPAGAEPREEPAAANSAVTREAAALPDSQSSAEADAPDTVPDMLHELPHEPTPAGATETGNDATAAEAAPSAGNAAKPGLSPAECGARLAELFPALFVAPGAPGPAKPIKLRIHADIQARAPGAFSKRVLGLFFSRYTTTNAYLKALAHAPHRFDLDGEPAGEIAAEHRQAATEELARRHALAAQRRALQRPPARRDGTAAVGEADAGTPPRRANDRPAPRPELRPEPRPERMARPPRGDRPPRDRAEAGRAAAPSDRPPRRPSPPAHAQAHAQRPPPRHEAPAAAALPTDPAQRERAMLLRSFESSPLSKANFCALKGISEAVLDAALQQGKAERGGSGR